MARIDRSAPTARISALLLALAAPAAAGEAVDVNASALNVRTSASTSASKIGMALRGQSYAVLSRSGSWARIQFDHRAGWAHADFLRATNKTVHRVTASALNVRSGASTRFRSLGRLSRNQQVVVSGTEGAWRRISFAGQTAYVHGDFVTPDGGTTPPPPPPPPPGGVVHTVTASSLNVRASASTGAAVVARLSRGARVTVTSESGAWARIAQGWVHSDYLVRGIVNRPVSRAGFIQLPASGPGFVAYSSAHKRWGQQVLIYGAERAARRYHDEQGGARVRIGNISLENGGRMRPHASHRVGEDLDVAPMRRDGVEAGTQVGASTYSRTKTRRLIEIMRSELPVELIFFNDSAISGVRRASGHHNHFHLRIR